MFYKDKFIAANNAFMIKEMKDKIEKEARKKDEIETIKKLLTKKFGNLDNDYMKRIR